ncbi:hypothetical protein [Helicobacter pylori]|uniref:hypothetical protein n=1 Tax=Helicobacter pylori TaxID=210 RepID=UPI003466F08C|nr:hypothetical protein E5P58_03460 [Helicobacter pylori]
MLILIYSQTPLRALKNGVFKFHAIIAYHHLTNIIKVVLNPKILKYHFRMIGLHGVGSFWLIFK